MKKYLGIILVILISASTFGTTYKVGPGQDYTELGTVPWITLTAGDTVLIYWRSTPYASKIFIRGQGTAENPIVIKGVPDASGNLPVITGANATTNAQFSGYFNSEWTEDLGLFLINRGYTDSESYKPKYLVFEYLELTGVKPSNTFTDQFGNVRNYNSFSSAVHALIVENLTVRHCKIYDNAQGIFTNTNDGGEDYISRNILIEYNEIYGNGNAGPDGREHNIYTQASNTIIQYNFFGSLRSGSVGATIKDRSAGTIVRYNWIESSGRTLDLVENEGSPEIMLNEPGYHDVYVYGNIITNYTSRDPFSTNMIHYGFDNSPDIAKKGTLYFYHNTVYIQGDQSIYWYIRLFDLSSNDDTVALYNNIIHLEGTSEFHLMRDYGIAYIYDKNWIQAGYFDGGYGFAGEVHVVTQPISGTSPGFTNVAAEDFTLLDTSSCIDAAGTLPAQISTNYPVNMQYVIPADVEPRIMAGNAFDLGAYENDMSTDIIENNDQALLPGYVLYQNYPNPFNPATNLSFALPEESHVRLTVYNILGQQLVTVLDEVKGTGSYTVRFDASLFSSGLYIYKLEAGTFVNSKSMMLVR